MNISKENVDALNAVIRLTIDKADYEQKVEDVLKNYRKRVNMPGFRPGHVPAGMIKKMYGNMALVDEVNKLVSESLYNYIKENNLNLLGEPLPSKDQKTIDFEKESSFEFVFDVALASEVSVNLADVKEIPYYNITNTDDMVDGQVKNMTARFGQNVVIDAVTEKSMVKGRLVQLDDHKNPLEGGIENKDAVLSVAIVKDDAQKGKLLGAKTGDSIVIDPKIAFPNDTELSYLLKISKEQAASLDGLFSFDITEINEFKDAELNQDIFDKTFGAGTVSTQEEFIAKVKENLANTLGYESDYRFSVDARAALMAQVNVALPEEFLKRWMISVQNSEKKLTLEQIESEMPRFLEDLRWQMIKNSIIKGNDLKIDHSAILEFAKKSARMQFLQYGLSNIPDEHIESYAVDMLQNEEQRSQFSEGAANDTVIAFIKKAVKLNEQNKSREDFNKLFEA